MEMVFAQEAEIVGGVKVYIFTVTEIYLILVFRFIENKHKFGEKTLKVGFKCHRHVQVTP